MRMVLMFLALSLAIGANISGAGAQQIMLASPSLYEVKEKTLQGLNLSASQNEQLRPYRETKRKSQDLYTKARLAREDLKTLFADRQANEQEIIDRVASYNATMLELSKQRLANFLLLRRVLNPEQFGTVHATFTSGSKAKTKLAASIPPTGPNSRIPQNVSAATLAAKKS